MCIDFTEAAFHLGEDFLQSTCTGTSGAYVKRACDTDEVVGACDLGTGQIRRYYERGGEPYDLPTARSDCDKSKGRWSVPRRRSDSL